MRFSARLLGVTIAFLLVFFVSKVSFAQTSSPLQNPQTASNATPPYQQYNQQLQYTTPNTNANVPRNLHTWTQSVMIEVMSAMSCQLMGADPITKSQCLGSDQKTGKLGYVQQNGGVPAFLGKMITVLYTPPVGTNQYVQYLSQNFGIAKPTYAQGVGFNQLSPLIKLWTEFRDITYLLFVFLFIIVGIAIMLRVRIDPRTVMTIQNQIPKMIIGIILVTLSFPIAGFMVDLMWVSTYTVVSVISNADKTAQPGDFQTQLTSNPLNFANTYFKSTDVNGGIHHVASEVSDNVTDTIKTLFSDQAPPNPGGDQPALGTPECTWGIFCGVTNLVGDVVGGAVNAVIDLAGSIGNFLQNIVTGFLSMIVGFVAFLIIAIAIIYSLFKLWFALLKAYIMILIDVIFAPFWIIGGLFPGATSLGFTNWLRSLLGNLAAFPAVVALFAIGKVLIDSFGPLTPVEKMFIPPLIGNVHGTSIIASLIALGIILASPQVVETVKKAFKGQGGAGGGGGGFLGGAAVGAALGVGGKVVANPVNRARNAAFGTDPKTGQAKFGSAYIGRTFGGAAQALTGGGLRGSHQWVRNPGTLRGLGGATIKGAGKVVAPVAGKTAQVVTAIPVVGPVVGGLAAAAGKAVSKVTQVGSKIATPGKKAAGILNIKVPHPLKEEELEEMERTGKISNKNEYAVSLPKNPEPTPPPIAPAKPPSPIITARGQADVEAAKKSGEGK